jgi:hypothetical protein
MPMHLKAVAFLLLGGTLFGCEHKSNSSRRQAVDPLVARMTAQDSGFITKSEGQAWLLKSGLVDTLETVCQQHRRSFSANDTIGKFFRLTSPAFTLIYCNTMHACADRAGEYVLCTMAADGKIVQREFDLNSQRTCGKHSSYFRRVGQFFTLPESYSYGTGFCRTDINCFERQPANANGSIVADLFLSGTELVRGDSYSTLSLHSSISFAHDTLLLHYQQREVMRAITDDQLVRDTIQRFDVPFVRGPKGWEALDSTQYRKFCEY